MPSKGSPRHTIRIPDSLGNEVEELIERRNRNTRNPPWDFTGFILNAIREKLAKHERGRNRHGQSLEIRQIGDTLFKAPRDELDAIEDANSYLLPHE